MSRNSGIWVLGEVNENKEISRTTLELLGLGRRLAEDLSVELSTVFIGADIKEAAEESVCFGSDRTYFIKAAALSRYNPDLYVWAFEELCKDVKPATFLAGHTAVGQDLLPRLAIKFRTRVITDCVHLALDKVTSTLLMTKPIFGGNALAVFSCKTRPQMATVRSRVGTMPGRLTNRDGEVIAFIPGSDRDVSRIDVIRKVKENAEGIKLEDADVVVSGGRGIGSTEGFERLRDLARLLGGALGASRPPCDMGWISSSSQVGLTGKIVAPRLYLAIAISGTMQHLTGMSESKHVVAINKDEGANIFKFADYGVVGDYREILSPLLEELKKQLCNSSKG